MNPIQTTGGWAVMYPYAVGRQPVDVMKMTPQEYAKHRREKGMTGIAAGVLAERFLAALGLDPVLVIITRHPAPGRRAISYGHNRGRQDASLDASIHEGEPGPLLRTMWHPRTDPAELISTATAAVECGGDYLDDGLVVLACQLVPDADDELRAYASVVLAEGRVTVLR